MFHGTADVDPHHGLQLVHHGYTVLVTNADGTMTEEGRQGLFDSTPGFSPRIGRRAGETGAAGTVATVTLRNIRVGDAHLSIAFTRRSDGTTSHEVLDKSGGLHVLQVPPPQDPDTSRQSWRDALAVWSLKHAPGRVARALRPALGEEE
jgi:hypothetical protein